MEEIKMASQALEQIVEFAPSIERIGASETIDVYTSGTTVLYSFDPPPKPFEPFFPTSTGFGINVRLPLDEIKDYHETFKIDRYDNPYGGHSSITPTEGDKFNIKHEQ